MVGEDPLGVTAARSAGGRSVVGGHALRGDRTGHPRPRRPAPCPNPKNCDSAPRLASRRRRACPTRRQWLASSASRATKSRRRQRLRLRRRRKCARRAAGHPAALTASFVGKGRSYEDLINAASAVTRFLQRELGFFLGNTYLPEQAPNGGIVRIAVLEGRLDEVILNWPERIAVDRSVGEAYLARLTPGEILRMRDFERIVFLVNDQLA